MPASSAVPYRRSTHAPFSFSLFGLGLLLVVVVPCQLVFLGPENFPCL